jgi:cation:H+ antiporter
MLLGLTLLALAAVMLAAGAELFVRNAARTARSLGLSLLAVGLLLAGAEPEEALTGVIASAGGRGGLAAGDAIGANITMLTAVLGTAALLRPLPVGRRVRRYAIGSALAGGFALLVLADQRVGRVEGLLLLTGFVALVAAVWWLERGPPLIGELAEIADDADRAQDTDGTGNGSGGRGPLLSLLGLALMTAGGALAVTGATRLVDALAVRDTAVGLTALALATTAELFALVLAASRHDVPEVAVAGLVGAVGYNATVSLGLAAVVRPLDAPGIRPAAAVAALLPLLLALPIGRGGRPGRPLGAALVIGYLAYLALTLT